MKSLEQPTIDVAAIQKRANEAAEKAYLSEVDSYYTEYNSPYRKMIKKELEKIEFKWSMDLPNIMDRINDALSNEVDRIANLAIANTYLPLLTEALTGMEKEMNWSDFLKLVIEKLEPEPQEYESFIFTSKEEERWKWLSCYIHTPKGSYGFTLHEDDGKYRILGLPERDLQRGGIFSTMKISKDGVQIEVPYSRGIISDKMITLFFRLMLSDTRITMDCSEFSHDMFPEDHCHCD